MNIFGFRITIEKEKKEALGARLGYWYRIPGDPTDKIRLIYKKRPKNSKRCVRCQKEIRQGLVWDTWLVTPGIFNTFLDAPICTECGPDLSSVLNSFKR